MKLPSINYLFNIAKQSFLRFPLTLVSAFLGVYFAIYLTEFKDEIKNFFPFINLLITFALGIPLYFGLSIFTSSKKYSFSAKVIFQFFAGSILIAIYFSLPNSDHTHNTSIPYIRYTIFNIIVHLLVSFSPFFKGRKLNGFWNFNKTLFIRFWTSILYSGFLYVGLILALSALDVLFDIEIHEELYLEFYIVIVGLFNTWFFVSGIPENLEELETIDKYPKGLKIFTQYVLLPLLILYLIILYAYAAKILITWDWPKGIVSYMISCVSILGILNVLLFYPYGFLKDNKWINKFNRSFYFILFPLIAILFIAIGLRIEDYGITTNRYIIVLLGIWLTIVSGYFSSNKRNIKFIPMSLALILGLTSFGPWSMFSVSEKSQVNRLLSILNNNNLIQNEKIVNEVIWETDSLPNTFHSNTINTNENILTDSLHNEIKSIIEYLDNNHGFSEISELFVQNIDSLIVISLDSTKSRNEASIYMKSIGLEYVYKYNDKNQYRYEAIKKNVIFVNSYDYLISFAFSEYARNSYSKSILIDSQSYELKFNANDNQVLSFISEDDTANFEIDNMIHTLAIEYGRERKSDIRQSKMTIENESNSFKLKVIINSINPEEINDTTKITSLNGNLFLRSNK